MADSKLVRIDGDVLMSGIVPSLPGAEPPLWVDGKNVVFRERSIRPEPGQFSMLEKIEKSPVVGILETLVGGRPLLYWGTKDKILEYDVSSVTPVVDRSRAGGYNGIQDATDTQPQTRWSFVAWGNWIVASNGIDPVQLFRPGVDTQFQDLTGVPFSPFKVEIILKVKQYLLAFNGDDPTDSASRFTFWWSDADDIFTWVSDPANTAGSLPIRDLPSPIVSAVPLGEGAGVYSTNTLHIVQFIGTPFIFGAAHIVDGVGAVGKHSVVAVGREHYGFGPRGIFRTDGTQVTYIDQPPIHEYVYGNFNRKHGSKVVAWLDPSLERVVFFFPSTGSNFNDRAVGYDYRNQTWHVPGFSRSAASFSSVFENPITGDVDGNLFQQSVEGIPLGGPRPLALNATFNLKGTGWGELGWGELGWGGETSGIG